MEAMDIDSNGAICMDLDSYISQYTGNCRLQRLKFYVDNSRPNSENYRLLIQTAMECKNIIVYTDAVDALNNTCPSEGMSINVEWITQTSKYMLNKVDRLEQDIKGYQVTQDKENIRRANQLLGDHFHDCGDLSNATKYYQKSRDYGSTVTHTLEFLLNFIKVNVYHFHWRSVNNYVEKAEHIDETDPRFLRRIQLAKGLTEMSLKDYSQAARTFLNIPCDSWNDEIISPLSLLIYTTLCALASFKRKDLQRLLIDNNNFKLYLDMQPTIRNCILSFYNRRFNIGLQSLDLLKRELKLDLFLAPHIDDLYSFIRSESMKQYFAPYLCCDMVKMATAFNTTVEALELELMDLVAGEGVKIDSYNKVLTAVKKCEKTQIQKDVVALCDTLNFKTQELIVKTAILKAGLVVKSNVPMSAEEKPSSSQVKSSSSVSSS